MALGRARETRGPLTSARRMCAAALTAYVCVCFRKCTLTAGCTHTRVHTRCGVCTETLLTERTHGGAHTRTALFADNFTEEVLHAHDRYLHACALPLHVHTEVVHTQNRTSHTYIEGTHASRAQRRAQHNTHTLRPPNTLGGVTPAQQSQSP